MGVDASVIFKIAGLGILLSILHMVLVKSGKEDIALMASLAGLVIVLLMVVKLVSNLLNVAKDIFLIY